MAKLVFGLNQSLDGYIDHQLFRPEPVLFRHFIENTRSNAGAIYGRRMYEVMRYWDEDQAGWGPAEQDYAVAWRRQPKWVASRTLQSVGPNATLIRDDLIGEIGRLKAEFSGELEIAGPDVAGSLAETGLIDEYHIFLHPVVARSGKTFFAGARPPLRLAAHERIGPEVIHLTYVPASPDGA